MRSRICLVTTGQPASNPRLVKEADALAEAGHDVHVVAAYSADWATNADQDLVRSRRWSQTFVDWRLGSAPWTFWKTRLRHTAARLTAPWIGAPAAADAAISRVASELRRAASKVEADLYIAHNLGALPAAFHASRRHQAKLGFDAEDFHAGQLFPGDRMRAVVERVERRYLPECDYLTASSPGIADAYRPLAAHGGPRVVLNAFPKTDRPASVSAGATDRPVTLYWFSQVIGPERGLEDIVRALGRTPEESSVLHVRGYWWPGYETTLRQLMAEQGVAPERLVSHALAAPGEMVRRSATYDIGLALESGRTENSDISLPNKIFTYLLGGQAILATRTAGQRWLTDQLAEASLTYAPGDVDALAAHLRHWIDHREALFAARRASWLHGDRRFNWETEQQAFLDVVHSALRNRDHRSVSCVHGGAAAEAGAR